MKVTISDVAKLAGVSTATVSHTINNTRYVSEETKEKVYQAIAELGYTPDASARSFRTGKKKTVGFIVPDIANKFFATMIESVETCLAQHGYHLIIANTKEDICLLYTSAIWDEVKDRLKKSALGLSGGQQQRLCIARALAVEPEVLLMDESTSALDPISTSKIEDLASELKSKYTVIMVTHNMQQAARVSDNTAFFLLGELVEFGKTEQLFSTPRDKRTEDYITGRFG